MLTRIVNPTLSLNKTSQDLKVELQFSSRLRSTQVIYAPKLALGNMWSNSSGTLKMMCSIMLINKRYRLLGYE